jgi:hypothetical protein
MNDTPNSRPLEHGDSPSAGLRGCHDIYTKVPYRKYILIFPRRYRCIEKEKSVDALRGRELVAPIRSPSEFHGAEPLQNDFTLFPVLVIGLTSVH